LEQATGRLRQLGAQFDHLMDIAEGIAAALVMVKVASLWLNVVIPHLLVCLAAADLTLVAATVVLGADYADSGRPIGLVHGVQWTILDAVR
jgi:hypothetical protein